MTSKAIFNPAAWQLVYGALYPTPSQMLFRRVSDEVYNAALDVMREGQTWLDLGCGTGEILGRVADEVPGVEVHGLDHDLSMLLWARERPGFETRNSCIAGNALCIPCVDGGMDGVMVASLTGCLDGVGGMFKEIHRILAVGGHAVISFTNARSLLLGLASRFRRKRDRNDDNHPCSGCYRRYLCDEVIRIAADSGLQAVLVHHFNCFVDLSNRCVPSRRIARLIERKGSAWVHDRLCRNFVVVFQKGDTA